MGASSVVSEGDLVGLLCNASSLDLTGLVSEVSGDKGKRSYGSTGGVGARGKWTGIPNEGSATSRNADSCSPFRPRLLDAIIQKLTMVPLRLKVGDVLQCYVVRRHVDTGVGIGATKGLIGCRWKVQVVWMLEEKLAKMQIDAVITDVTRAP